MKLPIMQSSQVPC